MRFNLQLSVAMASACVLLAGCADPPPVPQAAATPASVVAFPSAMQLAAGSSAQLQAQASDERDQAIGGASIVFRSKDPGVIGVTQDGMVSALGPVGVSAVQVASGVRVVEVPVRIVAGAGALLEVLQAPAETAQAGGAFREVRVQLRDQFKNPVAGAALAWTLNEHSGSLELASATTAADGTGSARWTASAIAGTQTLEVHSGDLPPVVLHAQVTAGPAASILVSSDPLLEEGATVEAGESIRVRAQVADQHGNGVGGVEVRLSGSGGCETGPELQATDDSGATAAFDLQVTGPATCVVVAMTTRAPLMEARMSVPVTSAATQRK